MNYYMGIDMGGTKCEALICDENANIVAHGICYGTEVAKEQPNTDPRGKNGLGRSYEAINKAFMRAYDALPEKGDLYITHNGMISYLERILIENKINYKAAYMDDEAVAVYYAANVNKGYLALVGTGAFCYYLNGLDRLYFDGLGPNLGDYGGGFAIGHAAVKAVARSEWDPEYRTSLSEIINKQIIGELTNSLGRKIVSKFYEMPERNFVASFAKAVSEEAEKGDKISRQILEKAAMDFGNTVRCLIKNIRPNKENLPIICNGSIITKSKVYFDTFKKYCNEHFDNEIRICPLTSVFGNVFYSMSQHGKFDKDEYYAKLICSASQWKNKIN